jgi:hypothetical protein
MEEGAGILTKRPQEEELKEYKVFKPLSLKVWIVISPYFNPSYMIISHRQVNDSPGESIEPHFKNSPAM